MHFSWRPPKLFGSVGLKLFGSYPNYFAFWSKMKLTRPWTDPAQSWTSESLACSTSQFRKVPTRAVLLREKIIKTYWHIFLRKIIFIRRIPAVRVEVNDIWSWESPGATDEEASSRKTSPTYAKKATPGSLYIQQRCFPLVLVMEFHGMRKALHRHQTWIPLDEKERERMSWIRALWP